MKTSDPPLGSFRAGRRVLEIQTKLHRWANDDPDHRFDDLFNLVTDPGIRGTLSFPAERGNVGFGQLDLGIRPPNGVGLAIDALLITGGGFLLFDQTRQEYAGVVQLKFAGLALSTIGLITIRPGEFSLLVIISVEFSPIQLGYGLL